MSMMINVIEAAPFKLVLPGANVLTGLSAVLDAFDRIGLKFKNEHEKIPVLLFDHVERLSSPTQLELLDTLQDYAKKGIQHSTVSVAFVSRDGPVPRHMMCKLVFSAF
jgi:hypothetical protein